MGISPEKQTAEQVSHHPNFTSFLERIKSFTDPPKRKSTKGGYESDFDPDYKTDRHADNAAVEFMNEAWKLAQLRNPNLKDCVLKMKYIPTQVEKNNQIVTYNNIREYFYQRNGGEPNFFGSIRYDSSDNTSRTKQGKLVKFAYDVTVAIQSPVQGVSTKRYKIHFGVTDEESQCWSRQLSRQHSSQQEARKAELKTALKRQGDDRLIEELFK